jgi:hypothetical protein
VAGSTYSFGIGLDAYVIKTDSEGDTLWTKTFGGTSDEAFNNCTIQQTSDNGYVILTSTHSFGTNQNIYMIKTDASGNSGCNQSNTETIISTPLTQMNSASFGIVSANAQDSHPILVQNYKIAPPPPLCSGTNISEIQNQQSQIHISPNPTTGKFEIISNNSLIEGVVVFNLVGEKIYSAPTVNSKHQTVNLIAPSGIYFVRVQTKEGVAVGKVVVE